MSSLPIVPRPQVPDLAPARISLPRRATERLRQALRIGLGVRKRLLLLGLLGLTLTLSVAGAALVTLGAVGDINARLAEVSRAQRFHLDADMMHDALRSDVAHAEQAQAGRTGIDVAQVRTDVRQHARQFRTDLQSTASLQLPAAVEQALADLRPHQQTYITSAETLVESRLLDQRGHASAHAGYERAFDRLVRAQAGVTQLLSATTARTEREADAVEQQALARVGFASLAAMAGWFGLVWWHHRSIGRLQRALLREAQHRSAADLLQSSLLPKELPHLAGIGLAARALPGELGHRVGGDWYDVIPLPTGELGLVVGDVLGHDLPAATAMGQLRNALRAYALDDRSPAAVLSRVNRAADLLDVVELATCVYAVLDPATHTLRWSSAGHLAPLVSSPDGVGRLVQVDPGPPLGAVPDADYVDHELRLQPGEAFALYSDGLVERRGACIGSGLDELAAVRGPYPTADAMCDRIMAALLGDAPHSDDVTLLVLQTDAVSPAT